MRHAGTSPSEWPNVTDTTTHSAYISQHYVKRAILFPPTHSIVGWCWFLCSLACSRSLVLNSNVRYLGPAPNPQNKGTNPQPKPMTVKDVIKLSKAGLSDDLIIQQIRKKGQRFDLATRSALQLKSASVSERVIASDDRPNDEHCCTSSRERPRLLRQQP